MKFQNRGLMEYFLEGSASEEHLNEILELLKSDEKFRKELAEASRMKGLLVSLNQENEDAVYRGVSRSISEMEPDSLELKILDSLQESVPEQKVIYKDKKGWLVYFWGGIAAQIAIIFPYFIYHQKMEACTMAHFIQKVGERGWLEEKRPCRLRPI